MTDRYDPLRDMPRRTWKQWLWRGLRSVICLGIAGVCLLLFLVWIISPTDQNHVVIVNHSGADYRDLTLTLETNDGQRHVLISEGMFADKRLRVINWPNAFFGEWVEVAEEGVVIGRIEAISRGRYGHSLIVLLNPDGKLLVSQDRWPKDANAEP